MALNAGALHHLSAAQGYAELGMPLNAATELDLLTPDVRPLPEVLDVRLEVFWVAGKWELMQVVAKLLAE